MEDFERGYGVESTAVFAAVAKNRLRFADLIDSLDEADLRTGSLCAGWTVRDVAGHLAIASDPSMPALVVAVLRAGGSYDRAMDRLSRESAARPVAELTATIRANAESRFAPPMVGPRGPLTDVLVHFLDVAVPLGLPYDFNPAEVRTCLEFVTTGRSAAFVPRTRLAGVRLESDDLAFSWGEGAQICGAGIDLLATACGRDAVLDQLSGAGVTLLRHRAVGRA